MVEREQDGNGYGVYARLYDPSGNAAENEFLVNSVTTGEQFGGAVAVDPDGHFIISFYDASGRDGSESGVFMREYDRSGKPLSDDFRVNTTTSGLQYLSLRTPVVMNDNSQGVVVWQGNGPDDDKGIFAQRIKTVTNDGAGVYNAYGGTVTTQNSLIAGNTAVHESPDVAGAAQLNGE